MADTVKLAFLICGTCKKKAIKAPPGATASTKYTCPVCTRRLPGSGFVEVPFYRRPAEDAPRRYGRVSQRWWDDWCISIRQGSPALGDQVRGMARRRLPAEIAKLMHEDSKYIRLARSKQQAWVEFITPPNIAKLPDQVMITFILVALMDKTYREASGVMGISEATLNSYLQTAKKMLSGTYGHRIKIPKKHITHPLENLVV